MLKISRVTLSGADDSVAPESLINLSLKYPQITIEWGLQIDKNEVGKPEYPSYPWLFDFLQAARAQHENSNCSRYIHTALHINGIYCQEMVNIRTPAIIYALLTMAQGNIRNIQLNFNARRDCFNGEKLISLMQGYSARIILQYNPNNVKLIEHLMELEPAEQRSSLFHRQWSGESLFDLIFDASLGLGITPETWPPQMQGRFCTYAGGLNPENLHENLERIAQVASGHIGIDTQTGLRTQDRKRFSIEKAEAVVQKAISWNEQQEAT